VTLRSSVFAPPSPGLDLLAFIERGKTRPLHGRNIHKPILPAALRLDESIAFGRMD
jgi:hypothetical protein